MEGGDGNLEGSAVVPFALGLWSENSFVVSGAPQVSTKGRRCSVGDK
jgi:hypothetical protein